MLPFPESLWNPAICPISYTYTWIFQAYKVCVPFHQKKLPKGRNVTHLEDPDILSRQIIIFHQPRFL